MRTLPKSGVQERDLSDAVRTLIQGGGNFVLTVTLNASATTTVVSNVIINSGAAPSLTPMTANAAAAVATTYFSNIAAGTFTLTHANNAQVDRTFRIAVKGG